MATIETDIDIKALKASGLRGGKLLDYAFNVLGYDGEKLAHVAIHVGTPHVNHIHAASMLEEKLEYPYELIDMQLARKVVDGNGRAYNRIKWIDKRREMMNAWADYLDQLRRL